MKFAALIAIAAAHRVHLNDADSDMIQPMSIDRQVRYDYLDPVRVAHTDKVANRIADKTETKFTSYHHDLQDYHAGVVAKKSNNKNDKEYGWTYPRFKSVRKQLY